MDAALKDGYSLAEVNAEAARRTGFKYDIAKADGHTDEDINQELRKRLKATPAAPTPDIGDGEGWLDKATGLGQAAATAVTGAVGGAVGWIPAGLQKLNDPKNVDFEKQYAANMEAMTYEPSREKGKEYAGVVGDVASNVLIPAATGVQGLPYANTLSPILGAVGKNMMRFGKADKVRPASNLAAELNKPVEAPVAPVEPIVDTRSGMDMSKQAYEAALREKELARQSAFNRPDELGNLTKEDPMSRMTRDLGAEPGKVETPQGPMESFYDRLTKDEGSGKTQAAQDLLDERAKDHNVRSAYLAKIEADQKAADLAAAKNMDSSPSEAHKAHVERIAQEDAHRAQIEETHAHMLEEQAKLEQAQKAVEARQKAVDDAMSGVKSQFEGKRALDEAGQPRNANLEFEAEVRRLMDEAPTKSREVVARELKAKLAQERIDLIERRAANEEKIQQMRDQHLESEARTKKAQEDAQKAIEAREKAATEEVSTAAAKAAAERKHAEALAKDQAKREAALAKGAKEREIQSITHPLGSKERAAAVKAINEKYSGKMGRATKKSQRGGVYFGENRSKVEVRKEDGEYKAYRNGNPVGRLVSNITPEQAKQIGESASVDIVKVADEHKGSGVGSALYKAWHDDFGGKIEPSGKTSKEAWSLWKNKYPEKVEAFVQQEAARIRSGSPTNQILGNITDPTIAQRVMDAAQNYKVGGNQGGKLLMSWGNKQKTNAFSKIPGVKDALRDIGNAMIESPKEAIELAMKFGDVSQNALQKGITLLTKGGTYLKSKVDNPVVHFTVDRFLQADSRAKAEISEKLHGEYLSSLRDLSKAEYQDAFTLLNAADLNQKAITTEMMQQYGLSTKLQDFITTHQQIMGDVMGKINAAREAVGKKPISARAGYSAMNLAGDYRKVAYKTINGEKVVVGAIAADRKAGRLGWTLEKIEKEMLAKDPTLEFGPLKDTTMRTGSTKGTPHEAFQEALDTIGENNPNVQAFLDTLKEVAKDDPSNYMGMQVHTMQKKGVWGMEGRKPWIEENKNATQFFENQTKYIEGAYNWSHLAEAAKEVNEVLRNDGVVTKQGNAIKMSEAYMQNALGLNPSRFGRAVEEVFNALGEATGVGPSNIRGAMRMAKAGVNTAMLSLNPSFLAIQLIQGPAAMPAMTALLRGRGLAPKATIFSGGLDYMTSAGATLLKARFDPAKLSTVEKGAISYAKENHVYATDMVEHSNTTTKGGMYYTNYFTQRPAALVETATRAQVFMSYVKMMDDSGLKVKEGLYEQAHRLTDQTMNNYGALEKPAIYDALGPVGSMAYNLKSFGYNEISRWSMLAREIPATGNAIPLLTQMATTITIAGVMGLPFYSQWESIYDTITSKLGNPRSLTLDVMDASTKVSAALGADDEKFRYVMSHGAPTMLGADISKRVGLGDVLANKASDVAFAGGSKLGSLATTAYGAAVKQDEPHLKAAGLAWAPPMLQGLLKDAWYTNGDLALSQDPDKATRATAVLNSTDKFFKKVGITGINESSQKEREYQLGKIDKTFQDKRDTAVAGMTFALAHGNPINVYVSKYLDNEGDPDTMIATINGAIESINMDPNTRALLRDSASKSITRIMSLQRRMEHQ